MAQYCINCNKKIGFMDSLNEIVNGSGRGFCKLCWSAVYEDMAALKNGSDADEVVSAYEKLCAYFDKSDLEDESRRKILDDLESVCQERLAKNTAGGGQNNGAAGIEARIKERREYEARAKIFQITTGFNFEGHDIIEYIDVLTEVDVQAPGFFGLRNAEELSGNIISARKNATHKLKLRALEKGANALIGVDYDVLTMGESVSIIATGTAVKIKKRGA